ncbi:MAG TPA: YeeE/YedE family protein [Candidatus Pelagibacter sp.]|jgi:uncharacterized membrane protein YedE/YeeE|nr:YeeE/YedE family protein [Candidatus Pelagibacter sp.]
MNIVNFTPFSAFIGGAIIGLAVVLFFIGNGRLAGVSGIASNFLTSKKNRIDNLLFLIGLVIGPIIFSIFINNKIPFLITDSYLLTIFGGLLVGIGTRVSGGCTSGHGICGIGRFSLRSIVATITFIFTGIVTVSLIGII